MRLSTGVLISLVSSYVAASCSYEGGNYYCNEVDAVVYENVGYSGSYSDVTNMDETSGQCSSSTKSFSGSNSPLDEELSVHFRGPIKLLQFGVYYPASGSAKVKRDEPEQDCTTTKHIHHAHKRQAAVEVVQITETVYVDQNGATVTAGDAGEAAATSSTAAAVAASQGASQVDKAVSTNPTTLLTSSSTTAAASSSSATTAASSSSSSSSDSDSGSSSSSGWNRVAYYTPGSATNITFMNTLGGKGSGVWSSAFGNSISYAASNGVDCASSSEVLGEVTFSSDEEFIIFSGSSCSDSSVGDCGYYRSGIPAYHGFAGASKIFVFEFTMPHDSSGSSNPDMPAIWMLNAKIPRTLQYGKSSCSCWSTGCGELDLFEILTEGDTRLISHIHDGQGNNGNAQGGGGSQDYFTRPTSGSMKGAVIFDGSSQKIHIVQLDSSVDFSSGLSSSTVSSWLSMTGGSATLS